VQVIDQLNWSRRSHFEFFRSLERPHFSLTVPVDVTELVERLKPTGIAPTTGFVFYPGGECDERGYAELLRAIAAQGYLVVLVPMPLQLAVLAPDRAEEVIAAFPDIESWAIGGHSLGGSIALRVAVSEPEVRGLVLMNPGILNSGVPAIAQYYFFPLQRLLAKQLGNRDFRESMIKGSFINPDIVTDEVMDNLQRASQSEGYLAGMTTMMGQYEAPDEEPLLAEAEMPTVIVATWRTVFWLASPTSPYSTPRSETLRLTSFPSRTVRSALSRSSLTVCIVMVRSLSSMVELVFLKSNRLATSRCA